jgi:DNA helicase-4
VNFLPYFAIVILAVSSLILFIIIRRKRLKQLRIELEAKREDITNATKSFNSILTSKSYISKKEYSLWLNRWNHLRSIVKKYCRNVISIDFGDQILELEVAFENGKKRIEEKNQNFITLELTRNKEFFDNIVSHPLSDEQRRAIIIDEKHTLVVAGAGTGKTSTIVAKVGYLIHKGLAKPNEILLLCYARKAKEEMEKRCNAIFGGKLKIGTFHGLGLEILGNVENTRPSISKLATDKLKLTKAIQGYIKKRSINPDFLQKLTNYFAYFKTPFVSEFEFSSKGEYIDFLRNNQVRSLKGDLVKSLEECQIANFLYINGIDYVYEADYEVATASKRKRQYKPDFYLPKYGIYIEHFGVDRNNNPAPFLDKEEYLQGMNWKQQLHKKHDTKLVTTYSWHKTEGILIEKLEKNLSSLGVKYDPIAPEQIFDLINNVGLIHPFAKLTATFLNLYKSSGMSIPELVNRSKELPDSQRSKMFVEIFSFILQDYKKDLGEEIDFNDMINKAQKYLKDGRCNQTFRYILVDEFQDISQSRHRLLKALVQLDNKVKLFCVGDDWQSIYRFTGSDISLMTNFDQYFNPSESPSLRTTFRFDDQLCEFSNKFILKNPNQIKKNLNSHKKSSNTAVTLVWKESTNDQIMEILNDISASEKRATVFIIGRYNHQKPENLHQLRRTHPNLDIRFTTAHSSKGREADYVIVIGLTRKGYSFPSQIEDDPILDIVLSRKEMMSNAEERRLFYVAITRARKHVYLIASKKNPSSFTREIEKGDYNVSIEGISDGNVKCPECKTGVILSREGRNGRFFSCSNYPYCHYKPDLCPQCRKGFLHKHDVNQFAEYYTCSNSACSFKATKCPWCKDGYLVERSGRYSKFYGCSNYPTCKYTRSL